ncbi:hypothetical protein JKF63_06327 [Porcisia hertigi]|uniref:Adenylate kinase n=1 Tax=Porcisia hertigi TaxID=2761500 RepID=A0A836I1F6_9TRYP|nr:hypothetical protein JKF63_06327 [Porcisia hertigi]
MPRISVFLSYVDSFVGTRLLHQFQQYPSCYQVYGCTWDAAGAEKLNAAASEAQQQQQEEQRQRQRPVKSVTLDSDPASVALVSSVGDNIPPEETSFTAMPHSNADTLSNVLLMEPGALAVVESHTTTEVSVVEGLPPIPPLLSAPREVPTTIPRIDDDHETLLNSDAPCVFFSRLDTEAVRTALLACSWIVLELRQAQTVLEVVQFLQMQSSFDQPKRLVLVSSLMTWYATPSLEGEVVSPGDAGGKDDDDDDDEISNAGDADDVDAPYPPPPPRFLEDIVAAAKEQSRYALVDAMRGDGTTSKGKDNFGGEDDEDEKEEASNAAPPEDTAEVLTEDQYNRRVPHLQYLNWRDAEKAVAAAHHANGLPLDTFVICAGLPYGGEEDVLEPLFRLAWCAKSEKQESGQTAAPASLPIFGSGQQHVPLVHAQDLACFVRKLLRCPTDAMPFPERRYLFATDGSNHNSWQGIVSAVNCMFGGRCAVCPVAPESYPLYRNVERFTIDLRVEPETMRIIMERTDDVEDEHGWGDTTTASAWQKSPLPNTWVAEGGIRRHLRAVADEFTVARHVDPHRIAIVGPPLVGKTYLATRVAAFYRLPCVSMNSVVHDYTSALQELRTRVESTRAAVQEAERARRLGVKRRRLLARQQREWDAQCEGGGADMTSTGGERGTPGESQQDPVNAEDFAERGGGYQPGGALNRANNSNGPRDASMTTSAAPFVAAEVVLRENQRFANDLVLSEAEEEEIDAFLSDWWSQQYHVHEWIDRVAEMERVLLLRLHPRPPTPEANPKKKIGSVGAGGASAKKKANKEAQKTREDEEELQQFKAALQHAPFQPRALALMLRWRLAQPDCRVQGFVLDGVPTTLELARLVFGDGKDEQLQPPLTEEEALRPCYANEGGAASFTGTGAADNSHDDKEADAAAAVPPKELASDARLPNHVVVLQASDAYLLSRLEAMGIASEEGAVTARGNDDATRTVDVEAFHHALQTYKQEYVDMPYSVLSYWECAAATTPPLLSSGGATGEERRAAVHLVSIEDKEPLVPPLPPISAFAPRQLSNTEKLLEEVILGKPHNFGQSLEEIQREAVRQRCLQTEEEEAYAERLAAEAAAKSLECAHEAETRSAAEERLREQKHADAVELDRRKLPMATYLQERVLPLLHKGLLEVCAQRPEDPVDYLAEWLIRHNPHDDIFCDL